MVPDFVLILFEHIRPIEEPRLLLPILALVIVWFEIRYLMFQLPKKRVREHQLLQESPLRERYAVVWREISLTVLSAILAWALLLQIILEC